MKVNDCEDVPTAGAVAEAVQTKLPGTLAPPPLSAIWASVWPKAMLGAVGACVTTGVALLTETFTVPVVAA